MTLLARDEIDIVDAWLAFHLNAGADLVIATDNRSEDGTTEVLERVRAVGSRPPDPRARRGPSPGRVGDAHGASRGDASTAADWVINSDADEFWWPRGASLSEVLAAVPPRYGTVGAFLRVFCPRPGRRGLRRAHDRPVLGARADQRPGIAVQADPEGHPPRPPRDRADARQPCPRRQPVRAAPRMVPDRVLPLPPPLGSAVRAQGRAPGLGVRQAHRAPADRLPRGHVRGVPQRPDQRTTTKRSSSIDEELERGLAEGRLVVDTRLRDALRTVAAGAKSAFPLPTLVEDAEYAVEAAVLGEADVVRLQRRLDELERRLQTVEQRLPRRVYRKLTRSTQRVLGSRSASG